MMNAHPLLDDDDDDMPELEMMGVPQGSAESAWARWRWLNEMDRLLTSPDQSAGDDDVLLMSRDVDMVNAHPLLDDDDDDMPELEMMGVPPGSAGSAWAWAGIVSIIMPDEDIQNEYVVDSDDDDMPGKDVQNAYAVDSDDDDVSDEDRPNEYVADSDDGPMPGEELQDGYVVAGG